MIRVRVRDRVRVRVRVRVKVKVRVKDHSRGEADNFAFSARCDKRRSRAVALYFQKPGHLSGLGFRVRVQGLGLGFRV